MSRYFVDDAPVAVYETDAAAPGEHVIWIKPKMDVATKGRVTSELLTLGADQKTVEFRAGANEMALLVHNIVRWAGPELDGVPCDAAHIRQLDPTEPHITRVLDEIAQRNKAPASPNPKSAADSSLPNAGKPGSTGLAARVLSATGTPK